MIGVIAEFSPFHNGHKYYLSEIRKNNPGVPIVVVMSNEITQRGEFAILSIEARARIAINYGADLVIELPFWRSNQAADYFALGAVEILNTLGVKRIICGSESANLKEISMRNENLNFSKNFKEQYGKLIMRETEPNDILAKSYYKAIQQINSKIKLELIKRKGQFHGNKDTGDGFKSATQIRKMINNNEELSDDVPSETIEELKIKTITLPAHMFEILKHNINTFDVKQIEEIMFVEEGIGEMLKQRVNDHANLKSFQKGIKIKQYTQNKVRRMLIALYLNYTKTDNRVLNNEKDQIRVINYNDQGRAILKNKRKQIIVNISDEKKEKIIIINQKINKTIKK